jgi:CheY-like chemotaxis protein
MAVDLSKKIILLVEDEKSLLESMRIWLRDNPAGFSVIVASDGAEGLAQVELYRPELVVSDVHMPVKDGFELLLDCRQAYPGIRFILMSAYGTRDMEIQSRRYGVFRFLHKPVDLAHLEGTIVEVLSESTALTTGGFLQGISIPGFVQLLNMERQSLVLSIRGPGGKEGRIHLIDGEIIHAVTGGLKGDAAAEALLGWEQADMFISRDVPKADRTITQRLQFLVMNAMRVKDERARDDNNIRSFENWVGHDPWAK